MPSHKCEEIGLETCPYCDPEYDPLDECWVDIYSERLRTSSNKDLLVYVRGISTCRPEQPHMRLFMGTVRKLHPDKLSMIENWLLLI
jgi:hypothetical protein